MFLQSWVQEMCRQTRQCSLQLPSKAALTGSDTDITDVMPDVEIATPWIERLDKKYFPTQKRDPLVLYRVIQTFMTCTIQEFYHIFLIQQARSITILFWMLCVSEQMSINLTGTNDIFGC
jgi:hypothetical protein